ncbi:MAG: DUF763 domain-containing protein, partial [Deltaproteobacteria bacterium]|nr:DUF763 domain-containing protein [Deltaproteobacteria bacterium]MBW2537230.1 DUF763 domain-containing protein [Deltaproteobacteria bacterium]
KTPAELAAVGDRTGLDGSALGRASRLIAKVDNTALQDGHQLYLHCFVVADDGEWVVVQQGMNTETRTARRYHWRSAGLRSFVEEPHEAVVGANAGRIVNLTDRRSSKAREATVELAGGGPEAVLADLRKLWSPRQATLPAHHDVRTTDVFLRRLHGVLALARERAPERFDDLLLTPGLGPRSLQALALVAEVAYGAPSRFDDPARFAFAHGGKDGHPFPVPLRIYDRTIDTLSGALQRAKLGRSDKLAAFQRLESRARELEEAAKGPPLDAIMDDEWARSPGRGGMTVLGPASDAVRRRVQGPSQPPSSVPHVQRRSRRRQVVEDPKQLRLFG